jgi:hypothetical protein
MARSVNHLQAESPKTPGSDGPLAAIRGTKATRCGGRVRFLQVIVFMLLV